MCNVMTGVTGIDIYAPSATFLRNARSAKQGKLTSPQDLLAYRFDPITYINLKNPTEAEFLKLAGVKGQ